MIKLKKITHPILPLIEKLKEALSAGLKAFKTENYRMINGKIEKETEEIFEI